MKNRIAILFLAIFLVLACKTTQKTPTKETSKDLFSLFVEDPIVKPFYSEKKGVFAKNGMVAAAHAEASNAGVEILKMGGNAIDAAVATHFALAVVFPFAGNLGGGGFAVIRTKNGQAHTLDFREKAPLKAHRDMYLDAEGNVIQGLSLQGHLASGVPGSVDGMVEMHEKFGKLPWAKLLEPSIKLAEEGVILTDREALGLNNNADVFKKVNGQALQYFMKPDGTKWVKGDVLVQKDLAET